MASNDSSTFKQLIAQLVFNFTDCYELCDIILKNRRVGTKHEALDRLQQGLKSSAEGISIEFGSLQKVFGARIDRGDDLARQPVKAHIRELELDIGRRLSNIAYRRDAGIRVPGFRDMLRRVERIEDDVTDILAGLGQRLSKKEEGSQAFPQQPQSNKVPNIHLVEVGDGEKNEESDSLPALSSGRDFVRNGLTCLEEARHILNDNQLQRRPLTEFDFASIASHLAEEKKYEYAKRSRIYCILWAMDRLNYMDSFVEEDIHDFSLPQSTKTLPKSALKSKKERERFVESQSRFLSQPEDFQINPCSHKHFGEPEDDDDEEGDGSGSGGIDSYYTHLRKLGSGAYGEVDLVEEAVTGRKLARKTIGRGRNLDEDRQIVSAFRIELEALKKLRHVHLVELVGSYTDIVDIGLLMLPIADYNLEEYLRQVMENRANRKEEEIENEMRILWRSYGCLSSALGYLHANKIRHRDIKPSNILVERGNVLLTDFGTAQEWQDGGKSTTMSGDTIKTLAYCSPEQADQRPRNRKSDIWSLGCVFLEILTVNAGLSVEADRYPFFDKSGNGSRWVRNNPDATVAYVKYLQGLELGSGIQMEVKLLTELIMLMVRVRPEERPSADQVLDNILEINGAHLACELCMIRGASTRLHSQNYQLFQLNSPSATQKLYNYPLLPPSISKSAKMVREAQNIQSNAERGYLPKYTHSMIQALLRREGLYTHFTRTRIEECIRKIILIQRAIRVWKSIMEERRPEGGSEHLPDVSSLPVHPVPVGRR